MRKIACIELLRSRHRDHQAPDRCPIRADGRRGSLIRRCRHHRCRGGEPNVKSLVSIAACANDVDEPLGSRCRRLPDDRPRAVPRVRVAPQGNRGGHRVRGAGRRSEDAAMTGGTSTAAARHPRDTDLSNPVRPMRTRIVTVGLLLVVPLAAACGRVRADTPDTAAAHPSAVIGVAGNCPADASPMYPASAARWWTSMATGTSARGASARSLATPCSSRWTTTCRRPTAHGSSRSYTSACEIAQRVTEDGVMVKRSLLSR